jgi:hypothetical protein
MDPTQQQNNVPSAQNSPISSIPPPQNINNIPFYRMYWPFAVIYLVLPPILGLIILCSGNIFRTAKDGTLQHISKREKVTLTILAFFLWAVTIAKNI